MSSDIVTPEPASSKKTATSSSPPHGSARSVATEARSETGLGGGSDPVAALTPPEALTHSTESRGKVDGIVKDLTIAYANWEESVKRHESELITLEEIIAFLDLVGDSVRLSGTNLDIFDRGKGLMSWIQGMALSKVKPFPGAIGKAMDLRNADGTRLAWAEWLQTLQHPISESTAYWCRRIFHIYSAEQAKVTGYSML